MGRPSRRGWTLILVPPGPGRRTRHLAVTSRTIAGMACLVVLTVAAGVMWTGATSNFANATADQLAESRRTVVSLLDSVQLLGALAERATHLPPKDMIMPVAGYISSGFSSSRLHPILDIFRSHRGVDLAAPAGTQIVAPAAGRVRAVGWRLGYGLTVEIEHSGGVVTLYAHCLAAKVHEGDQVTAGQAIATVGSSGLATGPHVHFEVLVQGQSVDPIKYLAASRGSRNAEQDAVQGGGGP